MGDSASSPTASSSLRLWRVSDVAEFYGVDTSTVHRWERSGRIRAARRDPGGTKYWLRSEVVEDALSAPAPGGVNNEAHVDALITATRRRRHRR